MICARWAYSQAKTKVLGAPSRSGSHPRTRVCLVPELPSTIGWTQTHKKVWEESLTVHWGVVKMRIVSFAALAGVFATITLSGCATIITGQTQGVKVETDPTGATCSVARGGEQLGVINSTPGEIAIGKEWRALEVDCRKDRHISEKVSIPASFQPATLVNILIGGIIGIAIDAISGAISHYPGSVTLLLVPSQFSSPQEREVFFDSKKTGIEDEATRRIAETRNKCASNSCEALVDKIEERKKQRLAEVEAQRRAVRVSP